MKLTFNKEEVKKALELLKPDGEPFEIRTISKQGEKNIVYHGFFTDTEKVVDVLSKHNFPDNINTQIYFTLNSINRDFIPKNEYNGLFKGRTTNDENITAYKILLIDLDTKREMGTSSSNEELEKSHQKAVNVYQTLKEYGFGEPITALSGNGYHLLYKVDFENTPENAQLVKSFLGTLSRLYSDNMVEIDTTVHNPARICKLYGTIAAKGTPTEERPHRQAKILTVPAELSETPRGLLKGFVNEHEQPKEKNTMTLPQTYSGTSNFILSEWIAKNNVPISSTVTKGNDTYYYTECPWKSFHTTEDGEKDAAIIEKSSGEKCFKCLHSHCSDRHWRDFRSFYEPNAYKYDTSLAMKFFKSPSPVEPVATEEHRADVETKLPPQTRKPIICNSAATLNLDVDSQPKFYIPQILGQGVTFLNAPPKCGKSRLFMQMALALCEGGYFMGRKCEKVGVLYLALEDEKCDFKPRLDAFLQGNNAPVNLYVATSEDFDYTPPTLENDELINLIESNLQAHSDIKVVLIDVFGAIRSKRKKGEDFMDTERRDIQSLIKLAAKNNIALAVSHHVSHTKKTKSLETIGSGAGSYVVAATVHAEMLLYKNEDTNSYTFSVQGRRMPLRKFAVIDDFPKWRFSGTAEEFEVANNPLIVTIKHIVDNSGNGQWCGLGADIVKYNQEHKLPPITATINKSTFSNKLIRQLSTISISYRQIKNGNGGVKHQFEKI